MKRARPSGILLTIAFIAAVVLYGFLIYGRLHPFYVQGNYVDTDAERLFRRLFTAVPALAVARIAHNLYLSSKQKQPFTVGQIVVYGLILCKPWDLYADDLRERGRTFGPGYQPKNLGEAKVPISLVLIVSAVAVAAAYLIVKLFIAQG